MNAPRPRPPWHRIVWRDRVANRAATVTGVAVALMVVLVWEPGNLHVALRDDTLAVALAIGAVVAVVGALVTALRALTVAVLLTRGASAAGRLEDVRRAHTFGRSPFEVRLRFSYTVREEALEDRVQATRVARDWQPGDAVEVRYDPGRPHRAVLAELFAAKD